ncbi:unnamed protein product, partial [Laminaria digitata]
HASHTDISHKKIKGSFDNHEQTGGGACCKRPRQRSPDASITGFFSLVATCDVHGTCPTQKMSAILQYHGPRNNKSRYVPHSTRISETQTGEVYYNQVKKLTKNTEFFYSCECASGVRTVYHTCR